jgi:hypothetical protein
MSEEAIKRRRRRALVVVAKSFELLGFDVNRLHGYEADMTIGSNQLRIKSIRICLDKPTAGDLSWLCEIPQETKRELWVCPYGAKPFLYYPCQVKKRTRFQAK